MIAGSGTLYGIYKEKSYETKSACKKFLEK